MLAGTQARVSLNGHFSAPFPVLSSVQQGSPLSTLLYVISAQPLAAHLRQQQAAGAWEPLLLPGGEPAPPSHQHADDTTLRARTPAGVAVALDSSVALHCSASGARLNRPKSKGLLFGAAAPAGDAAHVCAASGVTFPPVQEPIRHLGVHLGRDAAAASQRTFGVMLGRVRSAAVHWSQHRLSHLGRAHVAKQVLCSMLSYHAAFVPAPRDAWRSICSLVYAFVGGATPADGIGSGHIGHPGRHIASLPWADGGISLVDITIQVECLLGKVAARLLHPARHPWKQLMHRQLLRAFPGVGAAVAVSGLPVTARHALSPRHVAYMRGFQRTLPHRIVPAPQLSPAQVLAERLHYNRQVRPGGQVVTPARFPTLEGLGIHTVRQLLARVQLGGAPPPEVQAVWESLPEAWQAAAVQPVVPDWEVSPCGAFVRQHVEGEEQLHAVAPDGSLEPPPDGVLPPAAAGGLAWRPCCVVSCSSSPRSSGGEGGGRPFLVGPWESVLLDPSVWGHGDVPLTSFTVKAVAQRRIQVRAQQEAGGWFAIGDGCRPALWDPPAGAAGGSAARTGLATLEGRWATSWERAAAAAAHPRRRTAEYVVELLPCQQPGKRPRLGVHERLAQRAAEAAAPPAAAAAAAAAPPQPRVPQQDDELDAAAPPADPAVDADALAAQRRVWQQLRTADLPREWYGLAYRVLHGCLYVGGFMCHIGIYGHAAAQCSHPSCELQLETLTHAFVECPAVAPAAAWLCSVFAAVSGRPPPPADARVLLAADPAVWQPEPSALCFLWVNMRVAFLHAVWQLRCRRSLTGQAFSAAAVCGAVVAALRAAIRRDWQRVTLRLEGLDGTCAEWFRGRDMSLGEAEFGRRWGRGGVLCSVQEERLRVRFSLAHPVPAPVAPPAQPAAASQGAPAGAGAS